MDKLASLQVEVKQIDRNAKKMKDAIMRDYALNNARFAIGDILQGVTFTILVTSLKWGVTRGYTSQEINPYTAYYGKVLTKKLTLRKDDDTATLYDYDELIKLESKEL